MSFVHGKGSKFSITDSGAVERDLSAYLTNVELPLEIDLPDSTTLGASAHRHQVVGLKDATITLTGFFDSTATSGPHVVLSGLYGFANASTFKYGPEGSSSGKVRFTGAARLRSYRTNAPVDGLVPFTAELAVDDAVTIDTY